MFLIDLVLYLPIIFFLSRLQISTNFKNNKKNLSLFNFFVLGIFLNFFKEREGLNQNINISLRDLLFQQRCQLTLCCLV